MEPYSAIEGMATGKWKEPNREHTVHFIYGQVQKGQTNPQLTKTQISDCLGTRVEGEIDFKKPQGNFQGEGPALY